MATSAYLTSDFIISTTVNLWTELKHSRPLIQCITNTVVQNLTANVLLAAGASPAMIDTPWEASIFIEYADALLINLGTLENTQQLAIPQATQNAQRNNKPWVLDPVGIGVLPVRTRLAKELLAYQPSVIRANASEIIALGGGEPIGAGIDARESVLAAQAFAEELASKHNTVVAVSGAVDYITDGDRLITCNNGDSIQSFVTGSGCSLGALIAAFTSLSDDALLATAAAHICFGLAAQRASNQVRGPGTFSPTFIDELYLLDQKAIRSGAKVQ
ncbi:hydroxyethylthiazole kinase [Arcanobacterium ihumii]|uniref:hydroxyethylthiazole kinase n=1 Tax=Arcanobacterium ihumii TaxID=2138162 RepID=UPI001F2256F1|nr:hydroxyethylthiazole kinase [Arcanobacterium ihumii]